MSCESTINRIGLGFRSSLNIGTPTTGLGLLFWIWIGDIAFRLIFGIRVGNLFRIWIGDIDLGLKFGLGIEDR